MGKQGKSQAGPRTRRRNVVRGPDPSDWVWSFRNPQEPLLTGSGLSPADPLKPPDAKRSYWSNRESLRLREVDRLRRAVVGIINQEYELLHWICFRFRACQDYSTTCPCGLGRAPVPPRFVHDEQAEYRDNQGNVVTYAALEALRRNEEQLRKRAAEEALASERRGRSGTGKRGKQQGQRSTERSFATASQDQENYLLVEDRLGPDGPRENPLFYVVPKDDGVNHPFVDLAFEAEFEKTPGSSSTDPAPNPGQGAGYYTGGSASSTDPILPASPETDAPILPVDLEAEREAEKREKHRRRRENQKKKKGNK
jgi:hypothetical protein